MRKDGSVGWTWRALGAWTMVCALAMLSGGAASAQAIEESQLLTPTVVRQEGAGCGGVYIWAIVRIAGVTGMGSMNPDIEAELIWGESDEDPTLWGQFSSAFFGESSRLDDTYYALCADGPDMPGVYKYCFRFSYQGSAWVYADLSGSGNGLQADQLGVWTVEEDTTVHDADGDTIPDEEDNCPYIPNLNQLDRDVDTYGDVCDCAPLDSSIHPGRSDNDCNGIDNDCDGVIDEDSADLDSDGYYPCGHGTPDCDDTDPRTYPGAYEDPCDGIDRNCDGFVATLTDVDDDGWAVECGDCDDADPGISPGVPDDNCDNLDSDCDGRIDEDVADQDGDGVLPCGTGEPDCDDTDPLTYPRAYEGPCDGFDRNCDGFAQPDLDGDGVADACDNCPVVANPGQEDANGDGMGDACNGMPADTRLLYEDGEPFVCMALPAGLPRDPANPAYAWYRWPDFQNALTESSQFQGTSTDTLCIMRPSETAAGRYTLMYDSGQGKSTAAHTFELVYTGELPAAGGLGLAGLALATAWAGARALRRGPRRRKDTTRSLT